jgi:hypothetical protein
MKRIFFALFLIFLSTGNVFAQGILHADSNNESSLLDDILLFVNTDENAMGTKASFSFSSVKFPNPVKLEFELSTDNLLRKPWSEADNDSVDYKYEEPEMIPDLFFIPGTTRFVRITVSFPF